MKIHHPHKNLEIIPSLFFLFFPIHIYTAICWGEEKIYQNCAAAFWHRLTFFNELGKHVLRKDSSMEACYGDEKSDQASWRGCSVQPMNK